MKKLSVLVLTVIAIAIFIGQFSGRSTGGEVMFDHQLAPQHRLIMRGQADPTGETIVLSITYHNPPAIGTFMLANQSAKRTAEPLSFEALTDLETGVVCVFDNCGINFLLMYDPRTDDLWDSTGRSGGWHGSESNQWQVLLDEVRSRNWGIPYSKLPSGF